MLNLSETSPKGTKDYKKVTAMVIPGFNGQIEILPGHAEGFFLLRQGKVRIMDEAEDEKVLEVKEGGCYVKDDKVILIVDASGEDIKDE